MILFLMDGPNQVSNSSLEKKFVITLFVEDFISEKNHQKLGFNIIQEETILKEQ